MVRARHREVMHLRVAHILVTRVRSQRQTSRPSRCWPMVARQILDGLGLSGGRTVIAERPGRASVSVDITAFLVRGERFGQQIAQPHPGCLVVACIRCRILIRRFQFQRPWRWGRRRSRSHRRVGQSRNVRHVRTLSRTLQALFGAIGPVLLDCGSVVSGSVVSAFPGGFLSPPPTGASRRQGRSRKQVTHRHHVACPAATVPRPGLPGVKPA